MPHIETIAIALYFLGCASASLFVLSNWIDGNEALTGGLVMRTALIALAWPIISLGLFLLAVFLAVIAASIYGGRHAPR